MRRKGFKVAGALVGEADLGTGHVVDIPHPNVGVLTATLRDE